MPEQALSFLIDQNIPYDVVEWLRSVKPDWSITHVRDIGYEGEVDEKLYRWALENRAIIITFDEDFADARFYPIGKHYGVIRLRVWPTTIDKTIDSIDRLINCLPTNEWKGSLIIIDNKKIRVRHI